ncbi:unnamed protein product [Adineta ricciae]|uniref:Potassium channel tetramerisation-type BTB domain-containing protein n=1 Tax=Adineta ricciae TaxID=249248 RepID=A0A814ZUP6_ADIRI|nr:unnamed protein product [Adineta ricciae]
MATSKCLSMLTTKADLCHNDDELIKLNIGGYCYTTKRSTINDNVDEQSYLALLIRKQTKTPYGEYFIDRDGKYFRYILNYFREKMLLLPENFTELKQLLSEVQFYGIDRLKNDIENRLNRTNEQNLCLQSGLHLTLISKLNPKKTIVKLIGPLKLLSIFPIQFIGEEFLRIISSFSHPENILCQLTFPFDEKLISCQPFDQLQRFVLTKQARKMGLIVSYCDDYFYIPIEREIVSRDELAQLFFTKYNGKIVKTNVTHDDPCVLVENWLLSKQSDEIYSNSSIQANVL